MIAKCEITALLAHLEIFLSDGCEIGFACAGTIGHALAIMGKIPAVAIAGCLKIAGGKLIGKFLPDFAFTSYIVLADELVHLLTEFQLRVLFQEGITALNAPHIRIIHLLVVEPVRHSITALLGIETDGLVVDEIQRNILLPAGSFAKIAFGKILGAYHILEEIGISIERLADVLLKGILMLSGDEAIVISKLLRRERVETKGVFR